MADINSVTYINSKIGNQKIIVKSKKRWKDAQGNMKREDGKSIILNNGLFRTSDPDEIKFMDEFIKKYPNQYTRQTQKEVEKQFRINKKAKELVEEEDKAEAKKDKSKKEDFDTDKKEEKPKEKDKK